MINRIEGENNKSLLCYSDWLQNIPVHAHNIFIQDNHMNITYISIFVKDYIGDRHD